MRVSTVVIFASVLVLCIAAYTEAAASGAPALTTDGGPTKVSTKSPKPIKTTKPAKTSKSPKPSKPSPASMPSSKVTGTKPSTIKPVTTTSGATFNIPSMFAVIASVVAMLLKVYDH